MEVSMYKQWANLTDKGLNLYTNTHTKLAGSIMASIGQDNTPKIMG